MLRVWPIDMYFWTVLQERSVINIVFTFVNNLRSPKRDLVYFLSVGTKMKLRVIATDGIIYFKQPKYSLI